MADNGAKVDQSAQYMSGTGEQDSQVTASVASNAFQTDYPYQGARILADVFYQVEYFDTSGHIAWADTYSGTVVTAGLNTLLDYTLKTGNAAPAWYVGLIDGSSATVSAADTMASHAGWTENTSITNSTRPAFTPGTIAAGSVDNTASKAVFTFSADGTIFGTFMCDSSTKGGSTGKLYDAGTFIEGPHNVFNGGSLSVTLRPTVGAV